MLAVPGWIRHPTAAGLGRFHALVSKDSMFQDNPVRRRPPKLGAEADQRDGGRLKYFMDW